MFNADNHTQGEKHSQENLLQPFPTLGISAWEGWGDPRAFLIFLRTSEPRQNE